MMIVPPVLAAIDIDLKQLTFSQFSLIEARTITRETLAIAVRKDFQPLVLLVGYFDRKILPYADGKRHEYQSIVVSRFDIDKLLGIPKIPARTGALMGKKVVEFIHEWPGVK